MPVPCVTQPETERVMAILDVPVPQLSESVAEATLLQWHKKVGEAVARDENLIDIETDKVVLELPAPAQGVIVEILKGDGSTVVAGEIIARIDTEATASAGAPAAAAAPAAEAAAPAEAAAAPAPTPDKGDTTWMMVSTLLVILMTSLLLRKVLLLLNSWLFDDWIPDIPGKGDITYDSMGEIEKLRQASLKNIYDSNTKPTHPTGDSACSIIGLSFSRFIWNSFLWKPIGT